MNKKDFNNKMKWSPDLKSEGHFTQISNQLILNPNLTAEEKELILVFLMNKNGFPLNVESFCEDLHIQPRQVLARLDSLVNKGIFEIDDRHCKLKILKVDNPKHSLKAENVALDDTKRCVGTQIAPVSKDALNDTEMCDATQILLKKDALDDTKTCVGAQVKPELSLEQQGFDGPDKTNNMAGSAERTDTQGARAAYNIKQDGVNANIGAFSSEGRSPYEAAPLGILNEIPAKAAIEINSNIPTTAFADRTPLMGATASIPTEISNIIKSDIPTILTEIPAITADEINSNIPTTAIADRTPLAGATADYSGECRIEMFENIESAFDEPDGRSYYVTAPFVSEFWTDENTTNLNYRWLKDKFSEDRNFTYNLTQFEEILALALFYYLYRNNTKIPTTNKELQRFAKHIGKKNNDEYHISIQDLNDAFVLYERVDADSVFLREDLFSKWKIHMPAVNEIAMPTEPDARQLPLNQIPAIPVLTDRDRIRNASRTLRKKYEESAKQ